MATIPNFDDMTDEEIDALLSQIQQEAADRKDRAQVNAEVRDVILAARDRRHKTVLYGDTWVKPVSMLTAYLSGETITHEGALWTSKVDGNVCVPQDQVPPPEGCGSWDRVNPEDDDQAAS